MKTTKNLMALAQVSGLSVALILASFVLVSSAFADVLYRQLEQGMTGADVSALQTFLAKDVTIYPQGLVTGFFGPLTFSAVSNFQSRNGIATVGRVGPITLAAINLQMGGASGSDTSAPVIFGSTISVGTSTAKVHWNTSELAIGKVFYSTSWPTMTESGTNDVTVTGSSAIFDGSVRTTHDVTVSGLASNTTYYYVIYSKDAFGNAQITWPATFRTTN